MIITSPGFLIIPHIFRSVADSLTALGDFLLSNNTSHNVSKRATQSHNGQFIAFAALIPVLVLLSGLFAGLTLGYMSLDETQLNVLSISGTLKQREYAEKIKPIRKNGHLLLVTLLLANMIVNESLPVIADPVLGGGFQSVVVSTVLIVIFSEIIPQSLCTRHGLYIGAKMAPLVRVLIWTMGIVSWPVAKLLEFVLGPHHGIIYRRTELKELIALHSDIGELGGDLKTDTVTIIGATLDLQEKVVRQAMTPIKDVFMLSIEAKLDYETLRKICLTGHSRVPVYEEVEIPTSSAIEARDKAGVSVSLIGANVSEDGKFMTVKRILGALLVKQCVLLDPGDAIPIRKIPLNKVLFVPNNEPLLGILDKFQEGRSHLAIVSRFSEEKAASVKKAVKQSLTQRIRHTVGISDDSSSESENERDVDSTRANRRNKNKNKGKEEDVSEGSIYDDDQAPTLRDDDTIKKDFATGEEADDEENRERARFTIRSRSKSRRIRRSSHKANAGTRKITDLEMGIVNKQKSERASFTTSGLEQITPADAVLAKEDAKDLLQILDPAIMPLGIITLEDVLEELIGEEIYDEFDPHDRGAQLSSYIPPESEPDIEEQQTQTEVHPVITISAHAPTHSSGTKSLTSTPILRPVAVPALKGFSFLRSKSAPPVRRNGAPVVNQASGGLLASATEAMSPSATRVSSAGDFVPMFQDVKPVSSHVAPFRRNKSYGVAPETPLTAHFGDASDHVSAAVGGSGRSTAPLPIEAILSNRKRRGRLPSAGSSASSAPNTPRASVVAGPSMMQNGGKAKGSTFKSSPLVMED